MIPEKDESPLQIATLFLSLSLSKASFSFRLFYYALQFPKRKCIQYVRSSYSGKARTNRLPITAVPMPIERRRRRRIVSGKVGGGGFGKATEKPEEPFIIGSFETVAR